jgi:hypothetical protein
MKQQSVERMSPLLLIIMFGLQALAMACSSLQQAQTKVQRQPLQKERIEFTTPTNYEPRDVGYDQKTGKLITYDYKPRVELIDEKSGKYAFKWIGYDGKEKTVIYQRKDAVDVIVNASVSRTGSGEYLYTYQVQNLSSSRTYLSTFVVQNLSMDAQPDRKGQMFVLTMSSAIYKFREGNWISFNDASDYVQINPGQAVNVELASSAPPGVVGCGAAGGDFATEGAGEDMPMVLENLLPGYKAWPFGYTIGPVDSLKTLSSQEKIKYLVESLPQFRKLGWMTDEAVIRYGQQLKSNDLAGVLNQLDQDLKTEQITTEVFAIIQAMK